MNIKNNGWKQCVYVKDLLLMSILIVWLVKLVFENLSIECVLKSKNISIFRVNGFQKEKQ